MSAAPQRYRQTAARPGRPGPSTADPATTDPPEVAIPVSLRDRIQSDVTAAMRSGDALRRDVLRMAQNAVYLVEKRDRRELGDDDIATILGREVKTRRESVEAFRTGGREDLAAKEEAEIAILEAYLPEQLDDATIATLVADAIVATGATNARDLGKVMGWLSPRTKGRADGRRVSAAVASALAQSDLAAHAGAAHPGTARPADAGDARERG
jgi:uncharacterized protein YqeY